MLILRFFKHSAVFVFCFFLVFSLLEIFTRIFIPQNIVPSYTASAFGIANALKANYNAEAVYSEGVTYQIKTNDKHLREIKNIPYEKPENTFRILCLGDSILFGYGVENEETFTWYLEKILNEKFQGTTFEVINAGTPGWSPLEYYLFLKNEGYKYSPDLVMITQFIDDITHLTKGRIEFENPRYKRTSVNEVEIFPGAWKIRSDENSLPRWFLRILQQSAPYETLARSSHLLNLVRRKLSHQLWVKGNSSQKQTGHSLGHFVENIGLKESDTIVAVGPTWRVSISDKNKITAIQYPLLMAKTVELVEQMRAKPLLVNLPTYQEVLGLITRSERLSFGPEHINFYPLNAISRFQNKNFIPFYFPKDNHWTPAGHNFAALLTFNFMVKNQMIPQLETIDKLIDITAPKIIERIRQTNQRIDDNLQASPKMQFNKAIIYKNRGQLELAKESIIRYLQKFKDDYEACYQLGIIYYKMGNTPLAEKYLKKAVEKAPDNFGYYSRLGALYFDSGQYEEALRAFSWSLKLRPDDPKILLLSGLAYLRVNNVEQAMGRFNAVLRLQPENEMAKKILAQLNIAGSSSQKRQ